MKKFLVILSFATLTSSVLGMNNIPQNIKGVMGISAEGWAQPNIVGFETRTPGSSHIIFGNPEKEKIFSQLVILATDGDIVEFKSLLEKNLDLKESSCIKNILLLFAVFGEQYEIVRWLIENGADVNTKDVNADTPLSLAFRRRNVDSRRNAEIIRLLMNHILSKESTKSAAEMISHSIRTVPDDIKQLIVREIKRLIYSFVKQRSGEELIDEWKYISSKGLEEYNVYFQKQENPNFDSRRIAQSMLFVRNKVDLKKVTDNLNTCIYKGDVEKLKRLLNEHPEIHPDLVLTIATQKGQFDVVKYAIDHGADVNVVTGKTGLTPLMYASIKGNFEIVKYLIDKGARVNEKDKTNCTALIYATMSNSTDIAKYLMKRGADVNALNGDQDTPIMWASKHNNFSVVELLLKHGAKKSINVANKEGVTTAIWAASNNNLKMLRLLVQSGVNINKGDKNGLVPMDFAEKNNNEEMMLFLIENGLNLEKKLAAVEELPLIWFSYKNNLRVVKVLVEKRANINVKTSDGDTPLMFAVNNNNFEMVKYLVEHGANVNVQNNDGDTPVQLAGKNKNREMVKFLIESMKFDVAA